MRAAHLCLLRDIYKAWIPWSNTDESVCGGGAGCRVGCEGKGHMRSGSSTRLHTQTTPKHTVSEPMQLINEEMCKHSLAKGSGSRGHFRHSKREEVLFSEDCWNKTISNWCSDEFFSPCIIQTRTCRTFAKYTFWVNTSSEVRKRYPGL